MTIYYLDPPAGAGKTYAIAGEAARLAKGKEPVIILQPSIDLLRQTALEIEKRDPNAQILVITSEDGGKAVSDLNKALTTKTDNRIIVLASQQAYSMIPHHARNIFRERFEVFCDEALAVHASYEVSHPCNHQLLTPHLSSYDDGKRYQPVILNDGGKAALAKIADGRQPVQTGDKRTDEAVRNLARRLTSQNWVHFILVDSLKKNPDGTPINDNLTIFSVLRPSIFDGFRRVTVASALFDQTLQFKLWRKGGLFGADGVDFKPRHDLKGSYRYTEHQNTGRLTIHTGYQRWSKTIRDRNNKSRLNDFVSAIKSQSDGGKNVLWSANKDIDNDLFDPNEGSVRLPHSPHGLNSYTHFNRFAMLSAYMPTPAFFAFLKERGIDDEEIKNAISRSQAYQALMRTSLRNPDSTTPVDYYEPDASIAAFLKSIFKDCHIVQMTGLSALPTTTKPSGRPRVHLSDEDRKRQHRRKKYIEESTQEHLSSEISRHRIKIALSQTSEASKDKCDENTLKPIGSFVAEEQYHAVHYDNIYRSNNKEIVREDHFDGYVELLKIAFDRPLKRKEEAGIITPGYIDDRSAEHSGELKENVIWARHIYLDIDEKSDLTPQILAGIFPELRLLAYSTFNHTKEEPRFRVIIPTSQIMTPREYETITMMVVDRIVKEGYTLKKRDPSRPDQKAHGIDMGKLHPQAGYYMPSQGKDPEAAFIEDFNDGARGEIDPDVWMEMAPPEEPRIEEIIIEPDEEFEANVDQERVEDAIINWRSTPKGKGNTAFFMLGAQLRDAGMTLARIEATLQAEAAHAHSPDKRKRQIKSIMDSLRRHQRVPA